MATTACSDESQEKKANTSEPEGQTHAADMTQTALPTEVAATAGEGSENLTRLSQDIVDYILAWKPRPSRDPDEYYTTMMNDPLKCFPQEYIDETTAILRDLAETNKRTDAKFKVFQDWARSQYEAKGCIEVDDTYIAQRVLFEQARTKEPWSSPALEELASAMDSQRKDGVGFGSYLIDILKPT